MEEIRRALPEFKGTILDVGCGRMPYRSLLLSPPSRATGYRGLDLALNLYDNKPDLTWDGVTVPLSDSAVESAVATEVLEHCPDPQHIISEIFRVLKPGGFFFLTVPFLWPLHDAPFDEFRYTPFSMERMLRKAGFAQIHVNAIGGWDASLAQMIGLWVRRKPMDETVRRILQRLVTPLCRYLLRSDQTPDCSKSVMITGLSATAFKA